MEYIDGATLNPKWLDIRLYSPNPKTYAEYDVIYQCGTTGSILVGRLAFQPENGYTEGKWIKRRNDVSAQFDLEKDIILYWIQHPAIPEYLRIPLGL